MGIADRPEEGCECAAKESAFDLLITASQRVSITEHCVQSIVLAVPWGGGGGERLLWSGKCEKFNKIKWIFFF